MLKSIIILKKVKFFPDELKMQISFKPIFQKFNPIYIPIIKRMNIFKQITRYLNFKMLKPRSMYSISEIIHVLMVLEHFQILVV